MSQTVKISDDELINAAKKSKDIFSRSLNGQFEHWAKLGRFIEESGIFDLNKVYLAFQGSIALDELSTLEVAAHTDMLHDHLERLDGSDDRILQELRKAGIAAVSMDREGNIIKDGYEH